MSVEIASETFRLPRAVEPGVEIFAVGDIHGRVDLLDALLEVAERTPREADTRRIVFLGDLIDRGPDSLGALGLAIESGERIGADETIGLMGNHETMMRLALDRATPERVAIDALRTWGANGGERVLAQFVAARRPPRNLVELRAEAMASLPPRIERWLEDLRPHARSGDLLFVHAGVHPRFPIENFLAAPWNIPLSRLDENRHWAWIRAPFLDHQPGERGWNGAFVVHGHTPDDGRANALHADQIKRFRLNLDGGSAVTGVARMGIFRGDAVEVISARGPTGRMLRG
jgi:serine/threonine protein phosphatase 1